MSREQELNLDDRGDEVALSRFERSRRSDCPLSIEACLPAEDSPQYRSTLIALILIDLEFHWHSERERATTGRRISGSTVGLQPYVERFPSLQTQGFLSELLLQALCLQQQMGLHPNLRGCLREHPGLFGSERELLQRLSSTQYCLQSPSVSLAVTQDATGILTQYLEPGEQLAATKPMPTSVPRQSAFDSVPETVGNYRLGREIGSGGMGCVYHATDLSSGQEVAVKLVLPRLVTSKASAERFRQEGRLAAAITHPRCVFVLAADQEGKFPYIAMEYVSGSNLHDYVGEHGPLELEDSIRKIVDVLDGLAAAHELGVIHRDIKPANCFVDDEGRVKVGDFGLSRSLSADSILTQRGAFMGTPQYCAPEQIRNDPVNEQCDVYSVSATLFFALTGQAPFHGCDAVSTMARAVSETPPPLRSLRPDLPRRLEKVIAKGLEKEPALRFRSIEELKQALVQFSPGPLTTYREQGARIGAYCVDYLVLSVVNYTFLIGFMLLGAYRIDEGQTLYLVDLTFTCLLFVVYFGLFEGLRGTTPGKRLFGLFVQVHQQGVPPSVLRAIARAGILVVIVDGAPLVVALILARLMNPGIEDFGYRFVPVLHIFSWGLLLSTMREATGYRGLHELFSKTCLNSRRKVKVRTESTAVGAGISASTENDVRELQGDWPDALGGFQVSHAIAWETGCRILACRDQELNRSVWLRFHGDAESVVSVTRAQLDRKSRLRWVASETSESDAFDVFVPPKGTSLDTIVGEHGPLEWLSTFDVIASLANEVEQAIAEDSLPEILTTDQVWMQADGTVLLLDFPTKANANPIAKRSALPSQRGFALLLAVASCALEGQQPENNLVHHEQVCWCKWNSVLACVGRRAETGWQLYDLANDTNETNDVSRQNPIIVQYIESHFARNEIVRAVIPLFARDTLARLIPGTRQYGSVAEFREKLLADGLRPLQRVDWKARGALSLFQPVFALLVVGVAYLVILFSGIGELMQPSLAKLANAMEDSFDRPVGALDLLMLSCAWLCAIWAFCFPGGWLGRPARIAIVDRAGAPVSRRRAALRSLIVWMPVSLLALSQLILPTAWLGTFSVGGAMSWTPYLPLGMLYLGCSMAWSRRGPQDLIAGTHLVPR